jgi:hypothetical protein
MEFKLTHIVAKFLKLDFDRGSITAQFKSKITKFIFCCFSAKHAAVGEQEHVLIDS